MVTTGARARAAAGILVLLAVAAQRAAATDLSVDAMLACTVGGLNGFAVISALKSYGRYCRNGATHRDENAERQAQLEALASEYSIYGSATDSNYTGGDGGASGGNAFGAHLFDEVFHAGGSPLDAKLPPLDPLDSCCQRHQRCYSSLSLLGNTDSNMEMLANFGSYQVDCSLERYSMSCDKVRPRPTAPPAARGRPIALD